MSHGMKRDKNKQGGKKRAVKRLQREVAKNEKKKKTGRTIIKKRLQQDFFVPCAQDVHHFALIVGLEGKLDRKKKKTRFEGI